MQDLADKEARRLERYLDGLSDVEMGRAESISNVSVLQWRQRRGLPANVERKGGRDAEAGPKLLRTYFDKRLKHMVKVYEGFRRG